MPASRITSNSPWHILFLLDDSGSMTGEPANRLNEALDGMIEELKVISQGTKPYFKLTLISFGSNARILTEAESEQQIQKAMITNFSGNSGSTNMAAAFDEAASVLRRHPGVATDFDPFVFVLTDGVPDDEAAAEAAAQRIKNLDIPAGRPRVVSLGLGDEVNLEYLKRIATNPELARKLQRPTDLVSFFPAVGTVVTSTNGAAAVEDMIMEI